MDISRAIAQINSRAQYLLTNANATTWDDIIEWYGPGPKPTPEQLKAAWEEILAQEAEEQIVEERILEAARGTAGKEVSSLTAAERNALVGVLLLNAGALDNAGKVRPVREWAGDNRLWGDDV